jgi:8-oxo-dGTP pyrophosphatase MutT (NUDIX family)
MELWDAYTKSGEPAGCDLVRGESIPPGLYHLVCDIIVRHIDGSVLLMQRDYNKDILPGVFEVSAGGSVIKGETAEQAAVRELCEETGIRAKRLLPLYRTVSEHSQSIHYGFLCIVGCEKSAIVLQPGETIGWKWLEKDTFLSFIESSAYDPAQRQRLVPCLETIFSSQP